MERERNRERETERREREEGRERERKRTAPRHHCVDLYTNKFKAMCMNLSKADL